MRGAYVISYVGGVWYSYESAGAKASHTLQLMVFNVHLSGIT